MGKIKFTSKKNNKLSKLQRASGEQVSSTIYFKGKSIASVYGASEILLYCVPNNVLLRIKDPKDHRYAVNWVKEHSQILWGMYPFRLKLKEKEGEL